MNPEQIIKALGAIRQVVSQAWFAIDDSEDRREEGYHCVPKENVDELWAALERARELIPEDGEPDYPHHLVDILIEAISQRVREAYREGWLVNAIPPEEHEAGPQYVYGCEEADWQLSKARGEA